MAISNHSDFRNASQIDYEKEMKWNILNGRDESRPVPTTYAIYAKFYTQYGQPSETVSDSIIYSTEQYIPNGSLIRSINDCKVYITKGSCKRHIRDEIIFTFYAHLNKKDIREIPLSKKDSYKECCLIRADKDFKVYEIENKTKRWLNMTAEEFTNSGRKWETVYIINEEEKGWYTEGEEIRG